MIFPKLHKKMKTEYIPPTPSHGTASKDPLTTLRSDILSKKHVTVLDTNEVRFDDIQVDTGPQEEYEEEGGLLNARFLEAPQLPPESEQNVKVTAAHLMRGVYDPYERIPISNNQISAVPLIYK